MAYAVILIILLPLLYIQRKRFMAPLLWLLESSLYSGILHVLIHYVVAVLRWYRQETHFRDPLESAAEVNVGWQTPLVQFWKVDDYLPRWIFHVEAVAFVVIVYLVFRYRPYRTQKLAERMKKTDAKGRVYAPSRPK